MRLFITLFLIFFLNSIYSQAWNDIEPGQSRNSNRSFHDFQESFEKHWEGKEIENGYYFENGKKEKAYGWKQFRRWEHFWESRVNMADGKFPSQRQYDEAYSEYRRSKDSRSISGDWKNLGPAYSNGGYAGVGRINQIAFHPTDPDRYWVTTPAAGLWTTEDGGENWRPLTDHLENLTCTGIGIPYDFDQSQTIYLGTGEMDSWQHDDGIGLLKSTDAGLSWQETSIKFNLADGHSVNKILIDPNDVNLMYAATSVGIYKSIDGGDQWELKSNQYYVSDMEFLPGDPSIIVAANKEWGRIYKLTNYAEDLEIVYNNFDNGARRIELATSISDPNIVYAVVTDDERGLKSIMKSTDAGSSYNNIYTPENTEEKPNLLGWSLKGAGEGGQGSYDLTLVTDPNNSNIIFCGGVCTWKSENGGTNWSLNSHWTGTGSTGIPTVHADKHYMTYRENVLFECNDGGLYRSYDGVNWENISNGIVNSQMYRMGLSQSDKYDIMTGLQDNGSKNYSNGEWRDVNGGDGMECMIDYSDSNIQYAESQYGNIRRTKNHWESKKNVKPGGGIGSWDTPYIIHPTQPNILYSGFQHVYISENRGTDWEVLFDKNSNSGFRELAISMSDPNVILASEPSTLWKTIDGGSNWTKISEDLPSHTITDIVIKHNDPNTIWVTLGGYNKDAVYESNDGGQSWKDISTGIPPIPCNTIIQNQQKDEIVELYAGTDFGTYLRLGEGNWQLFNEGMPKTVIAELEIYYDEVPAQSLLRAATYGRGLWESTLYTIESAPVADFNTDAESISIGQTVNFTDASLYTPYIWNWEFEGGVPSSSSDINPAVIYKESGTFRVSLSVSNGTGIDTIVKEDYVIVTCPEDLNYKSYKASHYAGEYIDLLDEGNLIAVQNMDNANSSPIPIGFPFSFNCSDFDHFILNTNGFIKLGQTPPSDSLLHYDAADADNQLFTDEDPLNDHIISIFNYDLVGIENPEFRVLTEGEAGNRICTIQYKGLKDKSEEDQNHISSVHSCQSLLFAALHQEFWERS